MLLPFLLHIHVSHINVSFIISTFIICHSLNPGHHLLWKSVSLFSSQTFVSVLDWRYIECPLLYLCFCIEPLQVWFRFWEQVMLGKLLEECMTIAVIQGSFANYSIVLCSSIWFYPNHHHHIIIKKLPSWHSDAICDTLLYSRHSEQGGLDRSQWLWWDLTIS